MSASFSLRPAVKCSAYDDCGLLYTPSTEKGSQCATSFIRGIYPKHFEDCCSGPMKSAPGPLTADILYCHVDSSFPGEGTFANDYGYTDFFLCLTANGTEPLDASFVCENAHDLTPEESSRAAAHPTTASLLDLGDYSPGICEYLIQCEPTIPGHDSSSRTELALTTISSENPITATSSRSASQSPASDTVITSSSALSQTWHPSITPSITAASPSHTGGSRSINRNAYLLGTMLLLCQCVT